jgi:drug/metabolite transporter (DMT)-like permease
MLLSYSLLGFSIVLGAAGQILLKVGALNQEKSGTFFVFELYTIVGLVVYFVAALAYIFSLRKLPLSVAFPSVSLSYFFVSLGAHFLLGEKFTVLNIFALLLISFAIFLIRS